MAPRRSPAVRHSAGHLRPRARSAPPASRRRVQGVQLLEDPHRPPRGLLRRRPLLPRPAPLGQRPGPRGIVANPSGLQAAPARTIGRRTCQTATRPSGSSQPCIIHPARIPAATGPGQLRRRTRKSGSATPPAVGAQRDHAQPDAGVVGQVPQAQLVRHLVQRPHRRGSPLGEGSQVREHLPHAPLGIAGANGRRLGVSRVSPQGSVSTYPPAAARVQGCGARRLRILEGAGKGDDGGVSRRLFLGEGAAQHPFQLGRQVQSPVEEGGSSRWMAPSSWFMCTPAKGALPLSMRQAMEASAH